MSKFDELKAAAEIAEPIFTDLYGDRYMQGSWSRADLTHEQDAFVAKATPAAILELLAIQAQLVAALKGTIALAWEDTREVKFGSTVMFGIGYDWDGWESLRMEVHTPIGAWAVWPSFGKYSVYGTHDGSMWFEKFKTREEAEEVALRQIDRLCPDYPTTIARAALAAAGAQP